MTKTIRPYLKKLNPLKNKIKAFYKNNQLKTIAGVFAILLILILASQFIKNSDNQDTTTQTTPLQVETLTIGQSDLTESTVGTVKNHSAITLVAQTAGPISKIYTQEGAKIKQGAWITHQSTGYNTGNAASIQRQLAQKNLEIAEESLKNTTEVVSKNRELANKNRDNTEELRKISDESLGATRSQIDTIKAVIDKINSDIAASTDPDEIQGLKQQLASFQGSLNQAESGLKNLEYSVDTDNPPTALANLNKDIVYLSTELQLKTAALSKDIASLNLKAAQISESLATVSAPFSATVERIYVDQGQYLTPGTPVAKITGSTDLQIISLVSANTANQIDTQQPIVLDLQGNTHNLNLYHVSNTPTAGNLYEIIITVPAYLKDTLAEGTTTNLTLPLQTITASDSFFIPLDAVFVTNNSHFVYILEDNQAKRRILQPGSIIGSKIEVKSGLLTGDIIILNRQVIENQTVEQI